MKSKPSKSSIRAVGLQVKGSWGSIKRVVLAAGLLGACALFVSSAFAQYSYTHGPYWPDITDHYSGITWINSSTTFNNSGSLIYGTSTLPTNTGPLALSDAWMTGNYWWAADVLVQGSDGVRINNTGTIQSIVSGYGSAQAVGIVSLQSGLLITNWGTIDGQVLNHDGEADGVWTSSQSTTIVNNGTISARSKFVARGINTQNKVRIVNNGTIQAICDAGTEGITANRAKAHCFGVGGDYPMYFENNGQIKCIGTSSTATNEVQLFTCWNNGPILFKNTGLLYSENSSPNGHSQTAYFGAQSYDLVLYNSGTITNAASDRNGLTMWYENDGDRGNMVLNNSGAITSPNTPVLFLTGHWGPPGFLHTYYTNTGTFSGGQIRLYGIPATIYEAGQVHATLFGLSDNSDVHVMGLPTIDPTLECGGSNSTLEFNLAGTLQQVNGNSVNGTNLSAFNLGQSGNIVVSGKTYRWSGAGKVSGIVNPGGWVPSPWQQRDIGAVGVAGGAVYCGGMFTVLASGSSIGGTADAFRYLYQLASNNCSIAAPVTVPQSTSPKAQAGVMIREGLNANAANVFVGVMPGNRVIFQYRLSDGGSTSSNSVPLTNTMCWVKLAQSGSAVTGYCSPDGTNWQQVGTASISLGTANYMGLALCNNNNSSNGMGTFYGVICAGAVLAPSVPLGLTANAGVEQVTLNWQVASNTAGYSIGRSTVSGGPYTAVGNTSGTNFTDVNLAGRTTYYYVVTAVTPGGQGAVSTQVSATPSAGVPSPWVAQDIGSVGALGSESYTNGVFTVRGAGGDIDNAQSYNVGVLDTCRFVYETNRGNCAIVTRVTSVQNIDPESKAGVMIRSGLNADAANVFVGITPGIGVVMSCRSSNNANGTLVMNVTNLTAPCWLALVQNGSTFSGYYSADGNLWTLVGAATVSMTGTEYLGLTVSSRDNYRLCSAAFDNVSAPGWPSSVPGPTGLTAKATSAGQVNLAWNALTSAASYNIKRALYSGGPYATIATGVAMTNYADLGAYAIADCYYVVSAIVGGSETANSSEAAIHHPKLTGTVIGTPGSWGGSGSTIAKVFDGNLSTYFDGPDANGDWVGLYFGASISNAITRICYSPRSGYGGRMVGGVFQGANQSDFGDAVTLYTVSASPASGVFTRVDLTNTAAFRCVRYVSPDNGYGNAAELEFYGYLAGLSVTPPQPPSGLVAAAAPKGQVALGWNTVTNAASYNVKRSITRGGSYTVVANVIATNFTDSGVVGGTAYYYVVSALNPGGESADSDEAGATPAVAPQITGSIIGTPGSWGNSGDTIARVFDNNLTTFFDAPSGSGAWVGLDLGASVGCFLTKIDYCPRQGFESRMVGGVFQGANRLDFGDAVALFTVTDQPSAGVFTSVSIINRTGFRYVRYLSPDNGYGNVAELKFYGYPDVPLPGIPTGLQATAISSNQVNLTWYASANATSYIVKRSNTSGGNYDIVASGVTGVSYSDTGLSCGTNYYYVVSAVNAAGKSDNSAQASATPQGLVWLSIRQTGATFILSWPTASTGFTLQSRTNLALGDWVDVTAPAPGVIDNEWQVTLAPATNSASTFYRLAK